MKSSARQTLLFSATLPSWVANVARKYMQAGHVLVDLLGVRAAAAAAAAARPRPSHPRCRTRMPRRPPTCATWWCSARTRRAPAWWVT